jgi:hypothetical protein
MDPLLQASPEQCSALAETYEGRGDVYQGFCMAGEADGFGIWPSGAGDKYVGQWRKGQRLGQGTSTHPDGAKYAGEWEADRRHGQGTQIYADGNSYEGELREELCHRHGRCRLADGVTVMSRDHTRSLGAELTRQSYSGPPLEGLALRYVGVYLKLLQEPPEAGIRRRWCGLLTICRPTLSYV